MANAGGGSPEFLGHPKGLTVLTATELWERFSYYGMQGLLSLYMANQLLLPGHVEHVLGFPAFRAAVESVFGHLSTVALASQIFGLYTAGVYATPILGGLIGDRWLGQRLTVVIGTLLMAAGHLLMTSEHFFLLALACLIIGAGFIKGNMAAQVGRLYATEDSRRTRAFGIYLIGLNVGAFTAPLVCGTLGEKVGYHWGFGAAGIGMLISLATYLLGQRHLPPDAIQRGGGGTSAPALQKGDGRRIVALLALMIPYILVFSAYQQSWNIFTLWADKGVERHIMGFEAPVTWFATLDGILTIAAVFVAIRLWAWQARRGREGNDSRKISEGLVMGAAGFLVLAGGTFLAGPAKVALLFPVIYFVLQDLMIPFVDTVTMSAYSKNAPAALNTTMIGVYYLGSAVANFITGWLGRFYEPLGPGRFWLLHAAIAGAGLVFMLVLGGLLNRMMAPAAPVTPGEEIEATALTVEASP